MANLLQDTINYVVPFCRYQVANIGASNQPIIGIANLVRNIIVSPPFTWNFNRNSILLTGGLVMGTQDYVQTFSDFGFLERCAIWSGAATDKYFDIPSVKNNEALSPTNTLGRPQSIAVQSNNSGVVTFRFSTLPDVPYPTVALTYQKISQNFVNLTDAWSPIPDYFSDVYNNLTLGYYMDSCQDPRASQYITRGMAGILARATGLTHVEKALFAQSYMKLEEAQLLSTLRAQQGQQAQAAR